MSHQVYVFDMRSRVLLFTITIGAHVFSIVPVIATPP